MSDRYVIQIKDDFSAQVGSHSLKLGANYNDLQNLGIINANEHFATLTFFDDPSVILNNRNGRYPQGFQTPGSCGSGSRPTAGPSTARDICWTRPSMRGSSAPGSRMTGG